MSGSASQALSRFERATKRPSFHPHATPTQLLDYSVMRDGPPDHVGQILRWRNLHVNERRGVDAVSSGLLAKHLIAPVVITAQ